MIFILDTKKQTILHIFNVFIFSKILLILLQPTGSKHAFLSHYHKLRSCFSNIEDSLRIVVSKEGRNACFEIIAKFLGGRGKTPCNSKEEQYCFRILGYNSKCKKLKQILKQHIHAEYYSKSVLPLCDCSHCCFRVWARLHWTSSNVSLVLPITSSSEVHMGTAHVYMS